MQFVEYCINNGTIYAVQCSYEDATAVVTTGKGKHYSLGLDLKEFDSLSASERIDFFDDFEKLMCRTLTFPLITVAAINGRHKN